jgi:hypothetical protein
MSLHPLALKGHQAYHRPMAQAARAEVRRAAEPPAAARSFDEAVRRSSFQRIGPNYWPQRFGALRLYDRDVN